MKLFWLHLYNSYIYIFYDWAQTSEDKCCYFSPRCQAKTEVPRDVRNTKSGDKTSSGEIGINIRTLASPKVGHDQMPGGVRSK